MKRNTEECRPSRARFGPRTLRPLVIGLAVALAVGCASRKAPRPPRPPYRELSPGVAFSLLRDSSDLLILDLRPAKEFSGPDGHIARAQNVPLAELGSRIRELAPFQSQTVLLYCDAGSCAEDGARELAAEGFRYLLVLSGGIEGWARRGFGLMTPMPGSPGDQTAGAYRRPTHARRLSDGGLIELEGDETLTGLFMLGRMVAGSFAPDGPVRGLGEFCREWEERTGRRGRHGWLELADGSFHNPDQFKPPRKPYVAGCRGRDGVFRPDSRDVVY